MSMHLSTPYQITKMLGELYCNFFRNHYGLKVVKPRFFNSYGPGEVPGQYRNVIPNFIYWALSGMPLPFTGDGDETRDFTYVMDTACGFIRAATALQAVGRAINIGTGQEISIGDLARRIVKLTGRDAPVVQDPKRLRPASSEVERLCASNTLAQELLGWQPQVSLDEGLQRTIDWIRGSLDLYRPDEYAV